VLQIITVPMNADLLEIKVAAINRNRMIGSEVPLLELKHLSEIHDLQENIRLL